jgi:hypothetical protein
MRIFSRSKLSITLSLLTMTTLLSSLMFLGAAGAPASAHAFAAPQTTLLKLGSLGSSRLGASVATTAKSAQTTTSSSDIEISPAADNENNPKLVINGSTPPIPPPPTGTLPPNPAGKTVTTSNHGFNGFNGTSHADQRLAGTGQYAGTQFSLEPPDQGLCVNGNFVLDAVNTALTLRTPDGTVVSGPTPLNQFFGLAPEVIRGANPVFGDFTSDPKCFYDAQVQRWFVTALQADTNPASGAFTGPTHVLIAVSKTSDPTGGWGLFSINTTNDGTNGTPSRPNCPCLGDQPLIGTDANGFYVTTNEFPQFTSGFNGALVYAISKQALIAAAAGTITLFPAVVLIDASQGLVPFGGLSFSIQPATQPPGTSSSQANDGTEYFLSSLDFNSSVDNRIAVWALTNTNSLNSSVPNISLTFKVIQSQLYGQPAPATQKDGPKPFADSQHAPLGILTSNDDRMNQVVFSQGVLWSGVNTIIQTPGQDANTGIAFFGVKPSWKHGQLNATLVSDGYVSVAGNNVLFPSIGMNSDGKGVMSFTLVGPDFFPTAAYMPISLHSTGSIHIAQAGASPEDGFTCTGGLCRWGDYSAATAAPDGSIWMASEFIPNTPRTVLANWGTFVSHVKTGDDN